MIFFSFSDKPLIKDAPPALPVQLSSGNKICPALCLHFFFSQKKVNKKCIVYFSPGLPNLPELTMDPDLQAIQQMQQQIASPQPPPRSAKISMDTQGDAANDLASANNPGSLAGASSRLPNGQPPRAIQSTT